MDLWKTGARATVEFALGLKGNVNEAKATPRLTFQMAPDSLYSALLLTRAAGQK
jgi:hypothetical protein